MSKLGIGDSSENDTFSTTDWAKAASMGVKFGVTRASTTGVWVNGKPQVREDTMFVPNCTAMALNHIDIYPYCWFDPRPQLTPQEQADVYLAAIRKIGPYKRPILDLEPSGSIQYDAGSLTRAHNWLDIIFAATGVVPAIYSYPSYINQMATKADISWMSKFYWFNAHWDVTAPLDPWPWYPGGHEIWQYTASMPGARYGFNAKDRLHYPPNICMAVME
jgi:hypothetical protein